MDILKQMISGLLAMVLVLGMLPAPAAAEAAEIETQAETLPLETVTVTEETVIPETTAATVPPETEPANVPTPLAEGELGAGTPDSTPPVLNSITFSSDTVTPGGSIEVIVDASDDVSGVQNGILWFTCDSKLWEVVAEATYYDDETGEELAYPDGKLHGTIHIGQYTESGIYELTYASLTDVAGNQAEYNKEPADPSIREFPDAVKGVSVTVTGSADADGTPPVLHGITLLADTVTAPGSVEVVMEASDEGSGLSGCSILFYCDETEKLVECPVQSSYWDTETMQQVPYEDGKCHGTLSFDQYVESGTFTVAHVSMGDKAGNTAIFSRPDLDNYYFYGVENQPLTEEMKSLQITVTETNPDGNPPALHGISLAADTVTAPGTLEVIIDASDDLSGINSSLVYFKCEETGKVLNCNLRDSYFDYETFQTVKYPDGKLHGTLEIDQYVASGTFTAEHVLLTDVAGNTVEYGPMNVAIYGISEKHPATEEMKELSFTVVNGEGEVPEEVSWSFDEDTNILHITGDGPMEDYDRKGAPWYDIRDKIFDIEIEDGITHIGEYAFYRCDHVVDITIPASVKSIGTWAFNDCDLMKVIFQGGAPEGYINGYKKCTAYYPENDTSWTEKAQKDLNSQFNWIPYAAGTTPELVTSGTCGEDLTWNFDASSGKLTISGSGAMEEFSPNAPWAQFRNDILSIQLDDRITYISNCAFEGCSRLRTVNIPESLKSNDAYGFGGQFAFRDCVSLDCEIVIPDGVMVTSYGMFYDCTSLKDVTLPDTLQTIGGGTFLGCTSLESIEIPDGVTSMNECSFYQCTGLKTMELPDSIEYISGFNFAGCTSLESINIPDGVDMIGFQTFANCTSLKEIELPDSVMDISYAAFANCWNLQSAQLPETLQTIDDHAFSGCRSLENIDIPASVTAIPQGAFYDCTSLERVSIPDTVMDIGYFAFMNCTSLKELDLPESLNSLSRSALYNCQSLEELTIPASVSHIGTHALAFCDNLREITFEGSAPDFEGGGYNAFLGCYLWHNFQSVTATAYYPANDPTWTADTMLDYGGDITWVPYGNVLSGSCGVNLTWEFDPDTGTLTITGSGDMFNFTASVQLRSADPVVPWAAYQADIKQVILPEGLTSIGNNAFNGCENLTEITIPASVVTIGSSAFQSSGLTEITFEGDAPAEIGENAFENVTATVNYPEDNATWTDDKMQNYGGSITWGSDDHGYAYGDANHDGRINAKDATLVLQKSVGTIREGQTFCELCADVTGDGKFNAKDSTMILRKSSGLLAAFPVEG